MKSDRAAGAAGDLDDVAGRGLGDRGGDGDVAVAAIDVDADAAGIVGAADRAAIDRDRRGVGLRSMPSPVMPLSVTVVAVKEPATPAS